MSEAFESLNRVESACRVRPQDQFVATGPDARDLLHRISATEVRDLRPGHCRHLVFTDDKGALVDAPLGFLQEDSWHFVAGPGRGPGLRAWIDRWILVDDVRIQDDPTESWRLGEADLAVGTVLDPGTAAGAPILRGSYSGDEADPTAWEELHFRAGRLHCGPATALGPIPLELGWKDLIAFDKGCYIGQEVIARLDSYDKVRRQVATARFAGAVGPGEALSHAGRRCGSVLNAFELGGQYLGWVLADRNLPADAALIAGTQTAGTLLRAPAVP